MTLALTLRQQLIISALAFHCILFCDWKCRTRLQGWTTPWRTSLELISGIIVWKRPNLTHGSPHSTQRRPLTNLFHSPFILQKHCNHGSSSRMLSSSWNHHTTMLHYGSPNKSWLADSSLQWRKTEVKSSCAWLYLFLFMWEWAVCDD